MRRLVVSKFIPLFTLGLALALAGCSGSSASPAGGVATVPALAADAGPVADYLVGSAGFGIGSTWFYVARAPDGGLDPDSLGLWSFEQPYDCATFQAIITQQAPVRGHFVAMLVAGTPASTGPAALVPFGGTPPASGPWAVVLAGRFVEDGGVIGAYTATDGRFDVDALQVGSGMEVVLGTQWLDANGAFAGDLYGQVHAEYCQP